ncbi:hypothetical protein A9264_06865 [Vibrio sp. UCD-FRSSP16_10]|uniref:hypothetical protein n=1 Tax=unclassified Vibrio TaxID=2614977 RepID=UPI0007FDE05B|nr:MULTISPECIES: hypothetical protein [unclassified Vibrio]OBT13383.1 hypothetical protein A9264_06865 [Vibrio sp. UCD-FRSSP16_10]OBT17893.1 hypothetical protein A9260_00855 [Vibrio sp. UCD-FRSSP16_30]
MRLIATRGDDWNLYRAADQYFESSIQLTEQQQSSNGEELLTNSGNLKQLAFNLDAINGWFNDNKTPEDFQRVIVALEPIIIELWKEKKLGSWMMEIY